MVDDEEDVLHVHQAMLEHIGLSVICANNGDAALQILTQQPEKIDMVVTDYHMPHMDGLEMTQRIQEMNPELPVLMVTAFREDEHLLDAPATGFRILEKPINSKHLRTHI
ncbi:MAG: response regulator, partial [Mariprofundaceae bacterium]